MHTASRRRRLLEYLIVLAVAITLNFMLPRLMPGDPLRNMGSTQRNDQLIRMAEGQELDVDGVYCREGDTPSKGGVGPPRSFRL